MKSGTSHRQSRALYLAWTVTAVLALAGCRPGVRALDAADGEHPLAARAAEERQTGNVGEAIALFRKALDDDPRLARVHLDLALLLHDRRQDETFREDMAAAIYHYRRYLELRPDTQKGDMVKERIRIAEQAFAARVLANDRTTSGRMAVLEQENLRLREEVRRVQAELAGLRAGGARPDAGGNPRGR